MAPILTLRTLSRLGFEKRWAILNRAQFFSYRMSLTDKAGEGVADALGARMVAIMTFPFTVAAAPTPFLPPAAK
jgi:hypothetical protein